MVSQALFTFALWCVSAWFVVRFNIVCGALRWRYARRVCMFGMMGQRAFLGFLAIVEEGIL